MSELPREAERAIAGIRAVGGDELVQAMAAAFLAFAEAQRMWRSRQLAGAGHDPQSTETALHEIAAGMEKGRAWLGPLATP